MKIAIENKPNPMTFSSSGIEAKAGIYTRLEGRSYCVEEDPRSIVVIIVTVPTTLCVDPDCDSDSDLFIHCAPYQGVARVMYEGRVHGFAGWSARGDHPAKAATRFSRNTRATEGADYRIVFRTLFAQVDDTSSIAAGTCRDKSEITRKSHQLRKLCIHRIY